MKYYTVLGSIGKPAFSVVRKKEKSERSFDIFFPLTEGCSEGLDAFRFFFLHLLSIPKTQTGGKMSKRLGGIIGCNTKPLHVI